MHIYSFDGKLAWSDGQSRLDDLAVIKTMIDNCVRVYRASSKDDKSGIDYIAELDGGRKIPIDAKNRFRSSKAKWDNPNEPEIALETWSIIPGSYQRYYKGVWNKLNNSKIGWTLDTEKATEFVLYKFPSVDTDEVFLISFQLLRMAFHRNLENWKKKYRHKLFPQGSLGTDGKTRWQSECMFLSHRIVREAIHEVTGGKMKLTNPLPKPVPMAYQPDMYDEMRRQLGL